MKKKKIKNLKLNKKLVSSLADKNSVMGGTFNTISCPGAGICGPETDGCQTQDNNCGGTAGCPPQTNNCPVTQGCITISCPNVGIC